MDGDALVPSVAKPTIKNQKLKKDINFLCNFTGEKWYKNLMRIHLL